LVISGDYTIPVIMTNDRQPMSDFLLVFSSNRSSICLHYRYIKVSITCLCLVVIVSVFIMDILRCKFVNEWFYVSSSSPVSRSALSSSLTRSVFRSVLQTWIFGKSIPR